LKREGGHDLLKREGEMKGIRIRSKKKGEIKGIRICLKGKRGYEERKVSFGRRLCVYLWGVGKVRREGGNCGK
jgi:hypothetical protein